MEGHLAGEQLGLACSWGYSGPLEKRTADPVSPEGMGPLRQGDVDVQPTGIAADNEVNLAATVFSNLLQSQQFFAFAEWMPVFAWLSGLIININDDKPYLPLVPDSNDLFVIASGSECDLRK